ncbi:hypothetical protein [uncultured Thiodictyon sp.]|uniref:hypothetical protein n=1 Tax=uncultured Thiodictyon sp. TaxID=1846217 RepID=UPI0025F9C507|nr:hypothetical protein [uncultured Thiodictyon sp.]
MPACTDTVVRRTRRLLILTLALVLPPGGTAAAATPALPPQTQQVLVDAVEAAAALDFYNARCRSDDSGRHSNNLNKQLVNKLRLTIVTVQDEMFPERSYRAVQKRLLEQSAAMLAEGCKPAKEAGLPEQLSERYRKGVAAIEALP